MKLPNAVQIKLVKTPSDNVSTDSNVTPRLYPTPDEVAEYATIAEYWARQAAKLAAVVYVGKKVVDVSADLIHEVASAHLAQ